MMVSMDRAGRIVLPREVRERLSLEPEAEFEVTVDGNVILLVPARQRGRRIVEVDGWPVIEAKLGLSVSDADVQRWRDGDRR